MRAHVLNAITGVLGLAAVVASASTLSPLGIVDDCAAPSTATVFVTVPASSLEPSTVYVTVAVSSIQVSLSEATTITLTRFATLSSTTTAPHTFTEYISAVSTSAGQVNPSSPYDSTITEVATVTITNVNLTPLPSGGSVTYTETPAPNGLLNYVVENGTTYWLDGQTPAPAESYVYSTSFVTVEPVYAGASSSEEATSTLTLQSTIFVTQQLTLTETLESTSSSSSHGVLTSASVGTGLPYTKGPGGWNSTKTASAGGILSGAITGISTSTSADVLANASPTLVLYSSLNIYETSHSTISKSSLAAQSGFNALSTPISGYANSTAPSDPRIATSSAKGDLTTVVINNQTVTWGASSGAGVTTSTSTCTETPGITASTDAPYIKSTFATSVRVTSAASGVGTSLSSSSSGIVYGSSSALVNRTASASSDPLLSLLSSAFASSFSLAVNTSTMSSSALGALTSITRTKSSSIISVASYRYSSPVTNSTALSSALGALTSLSSRSSSVASCSSSTSDDCTTSTSLATPSSTASSSAVGARTSSSSIKSSSIISAGSYSYSSPVASSTSSSALGGLTSLSSSTSTTLSRSTSSPFNSSSSVVASSKPSSAYAVSTSAPLYSSTLVPSSTSSSKTSTSVSSSASASSTCGEHGDFTLNFDDIPPLSIGNQTDENTAQPEPVFNPYHQFDFSDGFTVVPPPKAPYNPSSPPLFLEFIPNFNVNGTNTQAGPNAAEEGYSGQISDGDVDQTGCFRFNMYGASMGCDSTGPACDFTFTGYQLDVARNEVLVATQLKAVPACPALSNCNLTLVDLDYNFTNLAFVRINVTVAGQPKIWWMDDLRVGWYDNSCAKGLCRQTTHLP